jgi:hypothetical protein
MIKGIQKINKGIREGKGHSKRFWFNAIELLNVCFIPLNGV